MKLTLLDMVQTVLSDMSSDEVNSITDNDEAMSVARIIRSSYYDIVAPEHLPEHFTLFSLEASTDPTKPVLMTKPSTINSVQWVKYNKITPTDSNPLWTLITYKPIEDFLRFTQSFVLSDDNVNSFTHTVGTSNIQFLYKNDNNPTCYTTFDDNTVIFDAYWATVEATLQKDKTQCWGHKGETFQLADGYVPNLDADVFPLLLRESQAWAWQSLKNSEHRKAEREAKRQRVAVQRTRASFGTEKTNWFDKLPNYGRK